MDILGFLSDMPFWAWFILAAVLLVAELLTGTTFLLWPAAAAALLGMITTVQLDGRWVTQWLLFAGLTVLLGFIGKPYAERWINQAASDKPNLNKYAAGKVGRRGHVAVAFSVGRGRVRLGDTEWQAKVEHDSTDLAVGDPVEVVAMDGTVLVVKPAGSAKGT